MANFLDDDGGASERPAQDAEAEARADLLTADETTILALEIDALSSQLVLKCIQFGQQRDGFLQAMATHWDVKHRQFRQMQHAAVAIVENRRAASAARAEAQKAADAMLGGPAPPAPESCNTPGCRITFPHDHGVTVCPGDPESCPCDGHVTSRISARNVADIRAQRGKPEEG